MKSIAFVSTMNGSPWGGSEELWSKTASRLLGAGHVVSVNVIKWPQRAPAISNLIAEGARVTERSERGTIALALTKFRPNRVYKWLDSFRPDLVVISQGANIDGWLWMKACNERNIPFVTVAHCASEHFWPEDDQAELLAALNQKALGTYFVSAGNKHLTEMQLAVRLLNAEVIQNPVGILRDIQVQWPRNDSHWHLACVARLSAYTKGIDLILAVMNLPKWRDRPIDVTFYGNGPNERRMKALAELYKLENVVFAGHVSDITTVWSANHALLLASRYEGLPLVIVEAMFCGRPCIVTDVAGNAEIVEDNVTGFVAEAPTVRHLDHALERAWQARDRWQAMGQAASEQVRALVSKDPVGAFTEELLGLLSPTELL